MDAMARSRKNSFHNVGLTFLSATLKKIASASLPGAGLERNYLSGGGPATPTGAGLASPPLSSP